MRSQTKTRSSAYTACLLRRRGTAATEFVLVLPLMLLVGLGGLDIGRAVQHYSVMSSAASAGAQCAATNRFFTPYTTTAWETKIRDTVREELASLTSVGATVSAFDIGIETDSPPVSGGDVQGGVQGKGQGPTLPRISVTVDYDFPTAFRWPGFPRRIPLHSESLIRQYR